jgi:uncharacterized protein
MSEERRISEEMQSAFVDGELDRAEWSRIAAQMQQDDRLRTEICGLRAVKDLVRGAYAPAQADRRPATRGGRWSAIAALCLISAAAGWLVRSSWTPPSDDVEAALVSGATLRSVSAERVLVHFSSSRREAVATALDEIEDLLRAARRDGRRIRIEILANSGGLDLLRADVSPFPDRVAALRAAYPEVTLVACNQTIDRLREKGIEARLLPGVAVAPSALDQVVRRLQSGWAYVRT